MGRIRGRDEAGRKQLPTKGHEGTLREEINSWFSTLRAPSCPLVGDPLFLVYFLRGPGFFGGRPGRGSLARMVMASQKAGMTREPEAIWRIG